MTDTTCRCEHGTPHLGYKDQITLYGSVDKSTSAFCYTHDTLTDCTSCDAGYLLTDTAPGQQTYLHTSAPSPSCAAPSLNDTRHARCCFDGPCAEIGWEDNLHGSPDICGGSDENGVNCSGTLRYEEAVDHCALMGGRLCSMSSTSILTGSLGVVLILPCCCSFACACAAAWCINNLALSFRKNRL